MTATRWSTVRGCALRLILLVLVVAGGAGCADGANPSPDGPTCTAFGDPPAKFIAHVEPGCWGGKLLGPWADSDGTPRYACVYEAASTKPGTRLPMVVYLHPSLMPGGSVHLINLLHYLDSADLSDDPAKPGFVLLAPEGRKTTHYYPFPDDSGIGWDNWYRQLNPSGDVTIGTTVYKENVDAATIDQFISMEVATGKIDTNRIYVTGWSNGAAMGYIYGLSRPNIAAVAVYSAPDPFGALADPCPQKPTATRAANNGEVQVFNLGLPTMHVHNNCDAAGICPNGELLASQLRAIGIGVDDVIINSFLTRVGGCLESCGTDPKGESGVTANPLGGTLGLLNHMRWPFSWTQAMLDFFRLHPLSARRH